MQNHYSDERPLEIEDIAPKRVLRFDIVEEEVDGQVKFKYNEISLPIFHWDYAHLVSAIIRSKYSADDVEAIIINYGDGVDEHENEYRELLAWRNHAKKIVRGVISADLIPNNYDDDIISKRCEYNAILNNNSELVKAMERIVAKYGVTNEDKAMAEERINIRIKYDQLGKIDADSVPSGNYLNPTHWTSGMKVFAFTNPDDFTGDGWYEFDGLIQRCIKDGNPTSFDDVEYWEVM